MIRKAKQVKESSIKPPGDSKPLDCNSNGMSETGKSDFRTHDPVTIIPLRQSQSFDVQLEELVFLRGRAKSLADSDVEPE